MLGHADIKQTQRYLNITDEELRKVDDRSVGAPTPVEGGWPVASRDGLSVICQSRLENAHQTREILRVDTKID